MDISLTLLGTGTSHGVPVLTCGCAVCTSADPRNQRHRCSALLRYGGRAVLIDTATEFRLQGIRAGLDRLDAVLFTHAHADHIGGLDDVRVFSELQRRPIPCYGSPATLEQIRRRFDYIFDSSPWGGGKPRLDLIPIDGPIDLFGLEVRPEEHFHGTLPVLGFRFGPVAYVTDCNRIPEESMKRLKGLDTLVLDALRWRPAHPTHFTVPEALSVVERLRPRRCYLTHTTHELEYHATNAALPAGVELAYDGLEIDFRV